VVTPGEELWVKIIDIDLQRRRISLSIKQAAEGGEVSEEYREAFGEHAYDAEGNYIGFDYAEGEFAPETEAQAAWADFAQEVGVPVVQGEPAAEPEAEPGPIPDTAMAGALADAVEVAEAEAETVAAAEVEGAAEPLAEVVPEAVPEVAAEAAVEPEVPAEA
jgi:small subunit ribosomal protein S1